VSEIVIPSHFDLMWPTLQALKGAGFAGAWRPSLPPLPRPPAVGGGSGRLVVTIGVSL
jgi:hypothetical protein